MNAVDYITVQTDTFGVIQQNIDRAKNMCRKHTHVILRIVFDDSTRDLTRQMVVVFENNTTLPINYPAFMEFIKDTHMDKLAPFATMAYMKWILGMRFIALNEDFYKDTELTW